jgi:hypothetical protein
MMGVIMAKQLNAGVALMRAFLPGVSAAIGLAEEKQKLVKNPGWLTC